MMNSEGFAENWTSFGGIIKEKFQIVEFKKGFGLVYLIRTKDYSLKT